jgi:drug/metabolite transporter (DMT)-like permease
MIPKWIAHIKICLLILGVIIFGSVGNILTPIIVSSNETSTYFILLLNSVESFMIYFLILICITCYNRTFEVFKIRLNLFLLSCISGIISGLIGVCFLYASDPIRTPVIIQSILLGVSIFPNVIFSRFILNKKNNYEFKYIVVSICFLLLSIGLGIIPLSEQTLNFNYKMIGWITMYLFGVILFSLYSVLQEKFVNYSNDKF